MLLIFRGLANFIAMLPLACVGVYSLAWGTFFLLEGLMGYSFQDYLPFQLLIAGVLCLTAALMLFAFTAFLGVRGWHLVRRDWPEVPPAMINPAAIKFIMKFIWIPPAVGALATIPFYFMIWGVPDTSAFLYLGFYILIVTFACIPSVIIHEFLHAVGFWIAGRVPSNQVRFGVAPRLGAAYAYTHVDMQVLGYQIAIVLPALVLGVLPAYGGLVLQQPMLLAYGLVMLRFATGDFVLLWRTLAFPANTSLEQCAEQDAFLRTFAESPSLVESEIAV